MAGEKDEKFDEKQMEKTEEKTPEEKSWDEKWRRDPLSAMIWAAIFIWAGAVFLLSNLGYLDFIIKPQGDAWWLRLTEAWSVVLLGAGVILLVEVAIRLLVPVYRKPVMGTVIFAMILIGLGLGDLVNWGIIWAVILIILGGSILIRGFRGGSSE
jgi:hypothetical protein